MTSKKNKVVDFDRILNILQDIFLDNTLQEIKDSKSFEEFEDWDSLSQMTLGYQLEKLLGRKLKTEELESIDSINSIKNLIDEND